MIKKKTFQSTKYLDEFVNRDVFSWMTRSRLKLDSKEVVAIKNYQKTNLKIHLFIKKSDDEGKDFYIWVRSNHLILFRQLSKAKTETCRLSILNIISIFQLKMSCMTILRTRYR